MTFCLLKALVTLREPYRDYQSSPSFVSYCTRSGITVVTCDDARPHATQTTACTDSLHKNLWKWLEPLANRKSWILSDPLTLRLCLSYPHERISLLMHWIKSIKGRILSQWSSAEALKTNKEEPVKNSPSDRLRSHFKWLISIIKMEKRYSKVLLLRKTIPPPPCVLTEDAGRGVLWLKSINMI